MNGNPLREQRTSGRFIVMEGGEGVGKTTQWQQVTARLQSAGHRVVALREPGGTPAGDLLRSVLLDPSSALVPNAEALLFAASRAQLVEAVIRPALADDATVLVDRFLLSTYAYQGAGRGIPVEALRAINHVATNGLTPDLTLLLALPIDDALARVRARGGADRMEREDRAFHVRVHDAFSLATSSAWQHAHP
ncbi:MAG: dTMP kinase, partial [Gemmatimonas sp.]